MSEFVHLHNHSAYSLLDGACAVGDLVRAAKEMGMSALALTDHGVVHGLVEFYREASALGIKAILGCEVYTAPRSRFDRSGALDREPHHLLLLAQDEVGYHNLIQLSSRGHSEGFYYKPRVDWELLQRYHQGLIACSACLSGEIPQLILSGDPAGARAVASRYAEIFGKDQFYLELQDHGLLEERRVNTELVQMAKQLELPLLASNDTHYLRPSDAAVHDVLLCVQTGSRLHDRSRMRFPSDQFYLKSAWEMRELFDYAPSAISNTVAIAERCSFKFQFGQFHLPEYLLPPGEEAEPMLRDLVSKGLRKRYGTPDTTAIQRAELELAVIVRMGFVGYFLIVWDFVHYAKQQQIDVGPGRGSVTGSLVAYALEITEVDPLAYDLLFERFLNPERVTLPDIDIDFCFERRGEVIEYVARKYGSDHVAQIASFMTLGARGAVRDIGRVLEIAPQEVDRVAKMIPFDLDQSIDRAVTQSKSLQDEIRLKPQIRELFDLAKQIEGKPRNISMHAAGVVITPKPLTELLPLLRPKEDGLLTQYAMNDLEALGFLKMDFLGLRTLTLLKHTRKLVQQRYGKWLELAEIPLDDPETYALLSAGETDGVFQLESPGMRKVLRSLKPNCIEDVIATNALYRPGPMEHIPEFIAAKEGATAVSYLHPKMKPILDPTYGVLVYQEQVMRIAHELAGFSLGEADLLRRAMAKRDPELLQAQRMKFISGAERQGVATEVADKIFELIRPFGSYGFNKSHSAAYGILAYQTAWFKVHYPLEYAAALLSSFHGSQDQISRYVQLMKAKGMLFLPPDINCSEQQFSVYEGGIRFGLLAIKNMGIGTIEAILSEREKGDFLSLGDFCRRLGGEINKRHLEALIGSGAFDPLGERAEHLLILPELHDQISAMTHLVSKGQTSLLGGNEEALLEAKRQPRTSGVFSLRDLQQMELDTTGFVFTQKQPQSRTVAPVIDKPATNQPQAVREKSIDKDAVKQVQALNALTLRITGQQKISLEDLKKILRRYPGQCPVYLEMLRLKRVQLIPQEYWIQLDDKLIRELKSALGEQNVELMEN